MQIIRSYGFICNTLSEKAVFNKPKDVESLNDMLLNMFIMINMIWMQTEAFEHEKFWFCVYKKMIRYGTK